MNDPMCEMQNKNSDFRQLEEDIRHLRTQSKELKDYVVGIKELIVNGLMSPVQECENKQEETPRMNRFKECSEEVATVKLNMERAHETLLTIKHLVE